ncbi:MAG: hypothetical protein AB7K08_10250 [Microbacteriaceae bacterium]
MSDPRITPRAAAFHLQPDIEAAAQARASEFATHGDPSLAGKRGTEPSAETANNRVRVDWIYPSEVANRLAARGMSAGADVALCARAWLKQRGHRNADPVEINADPPPPNRPSGRRTPARDDPGRGLSM